MTIQELNRHIGNMDLYLIDQLLKGAFQPGMKILDAGCGEGRNLVYFMNNDFEVHGIDANPNAIKIVQFVARSKRKKPEHFITGDISSLPYKDSSFDLVISSAVLHFCENTDHFLSCIDESIRVLRTGGMLFIRMTTELGIKDELIGLGQGRFQNPDGSERFILSRDLIDLIFSKYPINWVEPYKSVVVDKQRSMGSVVLSKK